MYWKGQITQIQIMDACVHYYINKAFALPQSIHCILIFMFIVVT